VDAPPAVLPGDTECEIPTPEHVLRGWRLGMPGLPTFDCGDSIVSFAVVKDPWNWQPIAGMPGGYIKLANDERALGFLIVWIGRVAWALSTVPVRCLDG
jgi:hypothetical protein